MKEVNNLELKNSLVIWIFFCFLVVFSFGFEKWAQQFSKQPLLSAYWATYGTKEYTWHYSMRCDSSKSLLLHTQVDLSSKNSSLVEEVTTWILYVYAHSLKSSTNMQKYQLYWWGGSNFMCL